MTNKLFASLAIASLACVSAVAAEKKVQMKDLPPALQKAIQNQTQGDEIKGLSKETEKGVTSYEVETMRNGKHRDLEMNAKGEVTTVEEETPLDSIPAPAKAAIMKKVGAGKFTMVETVTKGAAVTYEGHYTTKAGKKMEVLVKPDGTETKED